MKINKILVIIIVFVLVIMNGYADNKCNEAIINLPPRAGDNIIPTDYTVANNWAIVTETPDKPVDVFLLYPTTYQDDAPLADINNAGMRERANEWFVENGSAFETEGNVYMPYYRQLNTMWALTQSAAERDSYMNGASKSDAIAAFEYFLNNFNNGRPFIIVSHSQGSTMSKEIVLDYLSKNPNVAKRMIAAYIIGYSITEKDLARNPNIKFAESADDTGVIISYNTVTPNADPSATGVILPGALAINPITWTREGKTASADTNLGSFIDGKKIMGLADATVATIGDNLGVIICSTADVAIYEMPEQTQAAFGTGSFHKNDINFYYFNLRENAKNRIANFLAN